MWSRRLRAAERAVVASSDRCGVTVSVPSWRGHARGANHRQPSDLPTVPNLLDRGFSASAPNQVWLADITYIETDQGWLYLAAVIDLYSRRIVGWAMAACHWRPCGWRSRHSGQAVGVTNKYLGYRLNHSGHPVAIPGSRDAAPRL
jgi:transposase InsO family protein